jgi:hypothetical protein
MTTKKSKKKPDAKPKKTGLFGLGAKKETVKKEAVKPVEKPEVKPVEKVAPVKTEVAPVIKAQVEKPAAKKTVAKPKKAKVEVVKVETAKTTPKSVVVPQAMAAAIKASPDKAALVAKAIKAGQITDINTLKLVCNTIIGYGKYDILQVGKSGQSRVMKVVIKAGGEVDNIKIS